MLAREQVEEVGELPAGRCERCDSSVVERMMRQWFLRIAAYAERLLAGIDAVDWPPKAKNKQRAWIGRRVDADGELSYRLHDWLISRQRYWETADPDRPLRHVRTGGGARRRAAR